jgi:D-aminopeptidase
MPKPRARDLGLPFAGTPGPLNAITDVAEVTVGLTTLMDDARGMRTGVTVIRPRQDAGLPVPVWAGHYALNGNGEMTGTHWIDDAGYMIGPVCITNTHGVGAVHHGAAQWMVRQYGEFFTRDHGWAMPVVAETYDGIINDINAFHVTPEHAIAALDGARSGPVAEGAVGGGTGMISYQFKAGTGTASRVFEIGGQAYSMGALVQANHGRRPDFQILGRAVGREMPLEHPLPNLPDKEQGSIIVVLITDAPLSGLSLRQVAKRAAIGIGRGGTPGGNSSGDIFLALSTANPGPMPQHAGPLITKTEINGEQIDPLYMAAVQAVEEAVVNAIVAGEDTPTFKPKGAFIPGIDRGRLKALFDV